MQGSSYTNEEKNVVNIKLSHLDIVLLKITKQPLFHTNIQKSKNNDW